LEPVEDVMRPRSRDRFRRSLAARASAACLVLAAFGCDCSSGTNLAGEQDADDVVDVPDAFDAPDEAPAVDADDGATEDAHEVAEGTADDTADVPECSPEPGTGPIPIPFSPENGTATGSPWAAPDALTLRPLFRWRWTPDGGSEPTFEIQVDDSCSTPGFAWCCFPSPEASDSDVTGTTWRPDTDLPVDRSPPVGRRYYSRMRACRAAGCSAWSDVRYLDVGRPFGDWNGDGWSDFVIGAPAWAHAFVHFGGAAPDTVADLEFVGDSDDEFLGESIAYAGDVNADGFGDLLVGTSWAGGTGRVYLHLGAAVPDVTPELVLVGEGSYDQFGVGLASAGDVNADGFADFLVGAPATEAGVGGPGRAYLYLGGAAPPAAEVEFFDAGIFRDELGGGVAGADLNGDGLSDVVLGAPGYDPEGYAAGTVYIHFGPTLPASTADLILRGESTGDYFGGALSAGGDLNGDGYADLLVGAHGMEWMGGGYEGAAYVFLGGPTIDAIPDVAIHGAPGDHLGGSVALGGDLDGNGFDDALVGAPSKLEWWPLPDSTIGFVQFHRGQAEPDASPDAILHGGGAGDFFGVSAATRLDFDGDGLADALVGCPWYGLRLPGAALLWLGRATGWPLDRADLEFSGSVVGDLFGSAVE
jgi:hypothetical protein